MVVSHPPVPDQQYAVQLVGPDTLVLRPDKTVPRPGAHQILAAVECVGLCQSDMKLLHQFSAHARKSPVLAHLPAQVLADISSYVPGDRPTVPGHEVVVRVVAIGDGVASVQVAGRYLVQADWRDLRTAGSNGAFGYNFEGGLQEYVLLDERATRAADGTSYLIPVPDQRGASQLALVEPWACVEEAFIHQERQSVRSGGTCLLVVAPGVAADLEGLDVSRCGRRLVCGMTVEGFAPVDPATLAPGSVDDLIVVGSDPALVESLLPVLATGGLLVLAQAGGRYRRPVRLPVGRVHYGGLRIIGHPGAAPAKALARIPATAEVRSGDHVQVVGAAGPMGAMAVIRLCSRGGHLTVEGADRSPERLQALARRAAPLAALRGVRLRLYNATEEGPEHYPDYTMLMVPVASLVGAAVQASRPKGIINIFAGIPAEVMEPIDLDIYCGRGLYFVGTSGSTMQDMLAVLDQVLHDRLDTNLSVAAVSGMAGAIAGLEAVRGNKMPGKILVYPCLRDLPLLTLPELAVRLPAVGARLADGAWTPAAEAELLRCAT